MNQIFEVEIGRPGSIGAMTATSLSLPATPFVLADALAKARITDECIIYSTEVLDSNCSYCLQGVPEGVWVNFPIQKINDDMPHEFETAMDALKVPNWNRTIVLETRCRFPNLQNLGDQYESVEQLISDANNFSYICEEAGQGAYCFEEHLRAAMELESCTELAHAMDISQNLHCYDFLPSEEHWGKFGRFIARKSGIIKESSTLSPYFDYAAYAATEIERLNLTPCAHGYIHRNEQDFCYEYSQPPQQSFGMEMK